MMKKYSLIKRYLIDIKRKRYIFNERTRTEMFCPDHKWRFLIDHGHLRKTINFWLKIVPNQKTESFFETGKATADEITPVKKPVLFWFRIRGKSVSGDSDSGKQFPDQRYRKQYSLYASNEIRKWLLNIKSPRKPGIWWKTNFRERLRFLESWMIQAGSSELWILWI